MFQNVLIVWLALGSSVFAQVIRVDCDKPVGVIRALHGVNGGPLNQGETVDVSDYWRELAIPLTRLHDCEWPSAAVADVQAVFPDLKADPSLPESYRFARTDDYLRAIDDTGSGIVYRLGESIEHTRRKHRVMPPADYDRWAAACLGLVRHYNEGWADGSQLGIRYWEIWNEPENRPAMWTGNDDDYYRLYATAAKAIKQQFPKLLVGGPSAGAIGEVVEGQLRPTPFLVGFLKHCREHAVALDFFSFHCYSDNPDEPINKAKAVRKWLDAEGFAKTELHLNEWNYLPENDWSPLLHAGQGEHRERWYAKMGGPEGAAYVASVLIKLQGSTVDVANFYTGDSSPFGLFTQHGVPKKTFYAMKAFRMLLESPHRVTCDAGDAGRPVDVCRPRRSQDAPDDSACQTTFRRQSLYARNPWPAMERRFGRLVPPR